MSPRQPSHSSDGGASQDTPQDVPQGDPWHAFGYLVAGVLVYGAVGWLVDRWLGTSFVVVIGILLGAGLGLYMTYARFNRPWRTGEPGRPAGEPPGQQKN